MDGAETHRILVADGLAFSGLLSDEERTRAARFHFQADRDRFTAGRGWTRWVVGRALGMDPRNLEFGDGPYGKPFVRAREGEGPGRLRFNRSHSGDWVLIAIAHGREVGVDVERIRLDLDVLSLARTVFTAREQAEVAALRGEARTLAFYRVWSRKEAVLKAWGTGLHVEPREVHVGADEAACREIEARPQDAACPQLLVEDVEVDGRHSGAVALQKKNPP